MRFGQVSVSGDRHPPLPDRRTRLEARPARRVRLGAGRAGCARARARTATAGAADHAQADARGAGRDISGQHDVQPVTIEKLRYLLRKATAVFGERAIGELSSQEIAAWRMTLSPGYRFEATQALRQVPAPGGGVGDARREPGQGRRRQPGTSTEGAAPVRVVGGAGSTRRGDRAAVRADDPVRSSDRLAAGGVDRAQKARRRSR